MWIYEKKLEYPVRVGRPNPRLAKVIITQYGGPDGELAASLRYLTQRYTMPIPQAKAVLTDIGTEELAHMEIVAALVYNLIKDAPWRKSSGPVWTVTMPITTVPSTSSTPKGHPGRPPTSNPRATLSPTFTKIWLPSRKPAPPMNT